MWVETKPSVQFSLQKSNFGNGSHKVSKNRYHCSLDLSNFAGFPYFVPNILTKTKKVLVFTRKHPNLLKQLSDVKFHQLLITRQIK